MIPEEIGAIHLLTIPNVVSNLVPACCAAAFALLTFVAVPDERRTSASRSSRAGRFKTRNRAQPSNLRMISRSLCVSIERSPFGSTSQDFHCPGRFAGFELCCQPSNVFPSISNVQKQVGQQPSPLWWIHAVAD